MTGGTGSRPRPMPQKYHCSICGKSYAMDWAYLNHKKLCEERERSKNNSKNI